MRRVPRPRSAALALLAAALPAASGGGPPAHAAAEERSERPLVCTSFYPLTWLAGRLVGGHARVACPLPADADPARWVPERDVVRRFQEADLILVNGAGFEAWLDEVSLPLARLVDTTRALRGELLRYEDGTVHTHGPEGAHAHEGLDGHTWLDPRNALVQAEAIRRALERPLAAALGEAEAAAVLDEGLRALREDLDGLDRECRGIAELLGERVLLASHPAYSYLAARYGWRVESLDLDPGTVPGPDARAALAAARDATGAALLLWESEPAPEVHRAVRDFALQSVLFSPCETEAAAREAGGDYLEAMRANLARLRAALEGG